MTETVQDLLDLIKKQDIKMVDYRFMDPFGIWQHFTTPASEVSEDAFEDGLGFELEPLNGIGRQQAGDQRDQGG